MNAAALLAELRSRDIRVRAVGGELHCDAPSGSLTPELQARLLQQKKEILELLAAAQALAAQPRALVPLQRAGRQPAIFAVPGHNGDVFCYRALAQALGTDQPFVVLLRPDNYIGFIASVSSSGTMAQSAGLLDHWLRRAE